MQLSCSKCGKVWKPWEDWDNEGKIVCSKCGYKPKMSKCRLPIVRKDGKVMFSKEHYEKVAKILRDLSEKPGLATLDDVFNMFALEFEKDNKKFDFRKFYNSVWEGGDK